MNSPLRILVGGSLAVCLACAAAPPARITPAAGVLAQWDQTRSLLLLIADEQTYEPITVRIALQGPADLHADLATALGRAGDPRGVDTLVGLVLDDDVTVRRAAVFALGELAEGAPEARPRASEALLPALVDGDRETGRLAVDALAKIGTPVLEVGGLLLALDPGERWARLLPALYRFSGPEVVVLARGGLTQEAAELRRWAAYALSRTPQPEALPELRALLGDPDPELRAWAARALGLVGERADLARLRPLLDDPAAAVIYPALRAGRLLAKDEPGPAEWAGRLTELVADPRPGVRQVALENAAPWLAFEPLRELVATRASTGPPAERGAALRALAGLATGQVPAATAAIEAARSAAEPVVRALATEAAAALGDSALLEAFASDSHPLVRSAVWAGRLTRLGAGEGAEAARRGLADPDPLVRATVLDWLAEHPVAPVEDLETAVQRALTGRALEECLAALGAVTARAKAVALERGALIAALEQLAKKGEHEVRRRAAVALADLGRPGVPVGPVGAGRGAEAYERVLARAREAHTVAIVTTRGTLRVRLTCTAAPLTCTNFLHLAEQGFFDGLTFHRVVPGFVIQGGDPRGDGSGGPGYSIRDEINPLPYQRGALGMALAGPHTGGSQFFITLSAQPHLAGGFTRFGELVAGDEVLDTIVPGDVIESIREVP